MIRSALLFVLIVLGSIVSADQPCNGAVAACQIAIESL